MANKFIMRALLGLHNKVYTIISSLALRMNGGVHPKHDLMRYYEFFAKEIKKGSRVLDIGCGYGQLARKLAEEKDMRITGIDIEQSNIEKAQRINPHRRVEYVCSDATKLKTKKTYEYIILSNVLEHIDRRVAFLKKINPLAPTILIRVPMVDRDWLTLYKKEVGVDYRLDPTHYTEYTEATFRDEMRKAGLRVQSLYVRFGEIYAVVRR